MTHPQLFRLRRLALAMVALAAAGCDSGTEPLRPAAFHVLSGEGETATVGSAVAVLPSVRVTTAEGRVVRGVDVVFAVDSAGGILTAPQQRTGVNGVARLGGWTLGGRAGPVRLNVSSPDMPGVGVAITVTAAPDVPAGLSVAVEPSTTAASGSPLAVAPAVRLVDRFGNASPVAGVMIRASTQGGVAVSNDSAATDTSGVATFHGLALSGPYGSYRLRFEAAALGQVQAAAATQLGGGAAHHLEISVQPTGSTFPGVPLTPAPVVRALDEFANPVTVTQVPITATLEGEGGTLEGTTTVTATNGTATFQDLRVAGTGSFRIRFTATGLEPLSSNAFQVIDHVDLACSTIGRNGIGLNLALGQSVRRSAAAADAPSCLEFDAATAAGQQYLVMFENMPILGGYEAGVYPGVDGGSSFEFSLESQPAQATGGATALVRSFPNLLAQEQPLNEWNFDGTPIYEGDVPAVPAELLVPHLLRDGRRLDLASVMAHPAVGDTVEVYLQGIPRLNVPSGPQKAVVRHVSEQLIIAEDLRLPSLLRANGAANSPLTAAVLDSIASEYGTFARVQGDLLFGGRYNTAVEGWGSPPRVLAVHTLMYADNIWGYTWPNTHYFAFDYWVGSDGSTRTLAQHPQRLADNLFMHEIAHIRHYGLTERAGIATRGNRWLVEGFARFSERLPIAMRLLGSSTPSRVGNLVLPRNPAFGNSYYLDDVPTYLQAGAAMFAGYGASSYVFDYFADQVALAGGDPIAAVRDFVTHGGAASTLDGAIARWLPGGISFPELFTRARIALYADDYGAGLPAPSQYLQFQLRESRPPGTLSSADPRNAWLKLSPGVFERVATASLTPGAARGVIVDGTVPTPGSARILIDATAAGNGVISITRIR